MICDCHTHFIPREICENTRFYKGAWYDREKYFSFLESNSIEKALLVYPSTDFGNQLENSRESRIYNTAIAGILKENPRIVAACLPDLERGADFRGQLKPLREAGFRAINLSSSLRGDFLTGLSGLFRAAEELDMPIFIHPQTVNPIGFERVKDALLMPVLEYSFDESMFLGLLLTEGILKEFEVKFIFSSLGGVVPFLKERFDRVYLMLRQRGIVKDLGDLPSALLKKVFVDTSGASVPAVKMAIDLFGEDNILWGSDYPVHSGISENLNSLDVLGGSVKEKIIYSNFKRIFSD